MSRQHSKTTWFKRGQSTVEYSMISHLILIGGGLSLMMPVPHGHGKTMIPLIGYLFSAMNQYYESIYFVLKSGAV